MSDNVEHLDHLKYMTASLRTPLRTSTSLRSFILMTPALTEESWCHKYEGRNVTASISKLLGTGAPPASPISAKLIWVRRWVWDECISAAWESCSICWGLLGPGELYPHFPRGGGRHKPGLKRAGAKWSQDRLALSPAMTHTRARARTSTCVRTGKASEMSRGSYS